MHEPPQLFHDPLTASPHRLRTNQPGKRSTKNRRELFAPRDSSTDQTQISSTIEGPSPPKWVRNKHKPNKQVFLCEAFCVQVDEERKEEIWNIGFFWTSLDLRSMALQFSILCAPAIRLSDQISSR